jgi:GNAT superfamily N-acetyltransferase
MVEEKQTGERITVQPMAGAIFWICKKSGDKYLSALLTVINQGPEGMAAMVLNIWTDKEHRRQGHAKELIEKLKEFMGGKINMIFTNWKQSNESGRKLMLACGFTHTEDVFVWRRIIVGQSKLKLHIFNDPVQALKDLQAGKAK